VDELPILNKKYNCVILEKGLIMSLLIVHKVVGTFGVSIKTLLK